MRGSWHLRRSEAPPLPIPLTHIRYDDTVMKELRDARRRFK
jgi:hypothetical protein